jgi:hypothetical protein
MLYQSGAAFGYIFDIRQVEQTIDTAFSIGSDNVKLFTFVELTGLYVCATGCKICTASNDNTACTSCHPGYIGSSCIVQCSSTNEYVNSVSNICGDCDISCLTCVDSGLSSCKSCNASYY